MFRLAYFFFYFCGIFLGFILFSVSARKFGFLLLKPVELLFSLFNPFIRIKSLPSFLRSDALLLHVFQRLVYHQQRTQHELSKLKLKAFNLGAYNFHRLFLIWNHYFAMRFVYHQPMRLEPLNIKLKAFILGAYSIACCFWKDHFTKEPYLVSVSESSTAITNSLPEGVLLEILARLPVKSLLRFRSVSKSWRDIMKEHTFITKHHLSQVALNDGNCYFAMFCFETSEDFGLLEKDEEGGIKCTPLKLPFLKNSPKLLLEVAGPCNGIVVISDGRDKLFLWNPATREYKTLPPSQTSSMLDRNSVEWWSCVGFGIDPRTKDYKVLRVWQFKLLKNREFIGKVEVMSLSATNLCWPKSGTWKIIPAVPPTCIFKYSSDRTYANGRYYWCRANFKSGECNIVWFDMGSEVFGKIELPKRCCTTCFERLVVLKGCVMLMRHAYTVEEENKYMYKLSIIDDDGRLTNYATVGPFMPSERPMGLWKNQELITLASSDAFWGRSDLIFYDINTNVIKNKTEGGLIESVYLRELSFNLFDIYNESLISFGG